MKRFLTHLGWAAALLWSVSAKASDPVGVYAIIDKVVLEPVSGPPERIQIWGAFVMATPGPSPYWSNDLGGFYDPPAQGYLYYSLEQGKEEVSRIEWADMQNLAGTGQCISFGCRYLPDSGYRPQDRVRRRCEKPNTPDVYPINIGITKFRCDSENPPVKSLYSIPALVSPLDGSLVKPGKATLVASSVLDPQRTGANYMFEIWGLGKKEGSPEIGVGGLETGWVPETILKPGHEYSWAVWAAEGDWRGPWASATFTTSFVRGDANGDGAVDISDAVALLEYLFLGGTEPQPLEAGDFNGIQDLDVSDSIYLLTYLFLGGPQPPPPFPEADSSPDC
jgi:hypothetical protein